MSTRLSRTSVWCAAGLAVAAALRVVSLGTADLSTDELQTLHAVRLPVGELVTERLGAGHVPLWFLLEKACCGVLGTSQFALRLPSVIVGLALLAPAWSLLRRLAGEKAAWWGAALLALHPLMVELSREARMYPLLALCALVAAGRAAATLDGERPGAPFWIAVALGPFVHATWAVAIVPLIAWLALERRGASPGARRASLVALAGLAASVALLAAALAFAHPQTQVLTRRPWPREIGVFLLRIVAGSDLRLLHSVFACVAVAGVWCSFAMRGLATATPRSRRLALAWAVGVPVLSVTIGLAGGVPWGPARYVQMAAVGVVLLAAAAAASLDRLRALLLVLLVLATSLPPVLSPATAWSDAAAALRDDASPVVVDDASSAIVLSHYLGRDVSVGAPPPGTLRWRRAALTVDDAARRAVVSEESSSR